MSEFLRLIPPGEALHILLNNLPESTLDSEEIEAARALGRVTAVEVNAPHPLPEFIRSTVDGYALSAKDTFGSSESMPGYLTLIGEVTMGKPPDFSLLPNTCCIIHTGGMLPEGADAVVMLENTQIFNQEKNNIVEMTGMNSFTKKEIKQGILIEIMHSVAVGENTINIGEDVIKGQIVLRKGIRIRPAEIGGCMALGILQLRVVTKPKVGIISSGDEVIVPEQNPQPGQVRDINSYSLDAIIEENGGEPIKYGIIPDSIELMTKRMEEALNECDAVIITAGSSASIRDTTAKAISSLGKPGILVHGINIRPGKPTILSVCRGKAVIGLPGNPVSALVIAKLFVIPLIEKLLGIRNIHAKPSVRAVMSVNVASQAGREDWIVVKLIRKDQKEMSDETIQYIADPIFGKSNLIFTLAASDGMVRIPSDATGINAGEVVEVFP